MIYVCYSSSIYLQIMLCESSRYENGSKEEEWSSCSSGNDEVRKKSTSVSRCHSYNLVDAMSCSANSVTKCPVKNGSSIIEREISSRFTFTEGISVPEIKPTNDSIVDGNNNWADLFSTVGSVLEPSSSSAAGGNAAGGFGAEVMIPLYSVIFILSVVGNILVIVTLTQNRRMRTVTNVFLLNLVSNSPFNFAYHK